MKVSEAIEILKAARTSSPYRRLAGKREAIKLGVNALIFYKKLATLNTGEIQGGFIGEDPEE